MSDENEVLNCEEFERMDELDTLLKTIQEELHTKPSSDSFMDELKVRNSELKKLVDKYQKKTSIQKIDSDYDDLKNSFDQKESYLAKRQDSVSSYDESLQRRELYLNEELEQLEQKKLVIDAKQRVLSQSIRSESDPQVLHVLEILERKLTDLDQQKKIISNNISFINQEWTRLKNREEKMHEFQRNILSQKRKMESDCEAIKSDISEKNMELDDLRQKESDLKALIQERIKLVENLDKQYRESKFSLQNIKNEIDSKRQLLAKSNEELEDNRRLLTEERAEFESQKKEFFSKINDISEKSRRDLSSHKERVLNELQEQQQLIDSKFKELKEREKIVEKLEFDLRQRENKFEKDVDSISERINFLDRREQSLKEKDEKLSSKESDLKDYENEIVDLEKTVLDLKDVLEKKKAEVDNDQKYVEKYKRFFANLKNSSNLERKFLDMKENVLNKIQSGNVLDAKRDYSRFSYILKSLPEELKSVYYEDMKELSKNIEDAFGKKFSFA